MTISRIVFLYLALLLLCALMLISAFFFDSPFAVEKLVPVASDAFKTVLGAAIGALSVALAVAEKKETPKNE